MARMEAARWDAGMRSPAQNFHQFYKTIADRMDRVCELRTRPNRVALNGSAAPRKDRPSSAAWIHRGPRCDRDLVAQAESRREVRSGRQGQLRPQDRKRARFAVADTLGLCGLLHGVDKRREPHLLVTSLAPWLKPPAHLPDPFSCGTAGLKTRFSPLTGMKT